MRRVPLEVCVDTIEKLRAAQAGGAARIELCSRLDLDGLSPDEDLLEEALLIARVPVHVMIRPRHGGFEYSAAEFQRLLREIDELRGRREVAGVVVGVLQRGSRIHVDQLRELGLAARPKSITFHRAFDQVQNRYAALEELCELHIDRLLTSGGAKTAWEGREELRELIRRAGQRLIVMPGGGVRAHNAAELLAFTGASELHSSTVFQLQPASGG
jgi:copper homeostasis protein